MRPRLSLPHSQSIHPRKMASKPWNRMASPRYTRDLLVNPTGLISKNDTISMRSPSSNAIMLKTVICFASFIYLLQNTCQTYIAWDLLLKFRKKTLKTLKIIKALFWKISIIWAFFSQITSTARSIKYQFYEHNREEPKRNCHHIILSHGTQMTLSSVDYI